MAREREGRRRDDREEARVLRVQPVAQVEPPHADQRQTAIGAGQGHAHLREPDALHAGARGLVAGIECAGSQREEAETK